jgi:hypothetical protein
MARRRQLSDDELRARRVEQQQRLDQAVERIRTSDGFLAWVKARGLFHSYSFNNQLLIAMQNENARMVKGFRQWIDLGRIVRKGERAIYILRPNPKKLRVEDRATGETAEVRKMFFKQVAVFDYAQTDPIDGHPDPWEPPEPLDTEPDGDDLAAAWGPLELAARQLGYTIRLVDADQLPGQALGMCKNEAKELLVLRTVPMNSAVRIAVHELAHAHGYGYKDWGRPDAERIVDAAAFLVCDTLGFDIADQVAAYTAGWALEGDRDPREIAAEADKVARQIEDAILPSLNQTEEAITA